MQELRKIEYSIIPLCPEESSEIEKKYGYFHKWITTHDNEYALIENKNGNVYMLSIFDYNIKFIKEFPKGRVLDLEID